MTPTRQFLKTAGHMEPKDLFDDLIYLFQISLWPMDHTYLNIEWQWDWKSVCSAIHNIGRSCVIYWFVDYSRTLKHNERLTTSLYSYWSGKGLPGHLWHLNLWSCLLDTMASTRVYGWKWLMKAIYNRICDHAQINIYIRRLTHYRMQALLPKPMPDKCNKTTGSNQPLV